MATPARAVKAIDWSKLTTALKLNSNTVASIQAFRKRNEEARRVLDDFKEQKTDIDFAHYRSVLKNTAIVDQAEKAFKDFKPVTYDVKAQLSAIDKFEAKAVERAQQTASKVDAELHDLQAALTNIEQARPVEDLTIDDVLVARPDINETLDKRFAEGKWTIPGYQEKFGHLSFF